MARRARRGPGAGPDARRVAGTVGLLGASVVCAAKGASGLFTAGAQATHATDTGKLELIVDEDADASQAFVLDVSGLYPGASQQRLIDVTIGDAGYKTLQVAISDSCGACSDSALTNDTTNGIKVKVERCSSPWTYSSGSAPNRTYTCSGTTTEVVGTLPLVGTKNLTTGSLLDEGSTNHYRFTFTLPLTAPESMKGLTAVTELTFDGTQRDGQNR
ncbi:MAG: hypothetical protein KatS3mg010_2112 [Acidimicrobiia bacterium]|nr:MAG: hypothetical protein KatS3mg010_2112 [Acidimicrobiia bacterium]